MDNTQLNRKSNKTYTNGLPKKIRIEQNRWEYEQICKSLRDGRCDDAINILLADTKELRSSEVIPCIESSSVSTELHHHCHHDQQQQLQQQQQRQQLNEQMNTSSNAVMLPPPSSSNSVTKYRPTLQQLIPTIRSKRDSVIMNLDKNRINVKRNKLLPRPLSLPISLKLFRNTNGDHHHHHHQQQHHQQQRHQASVNKINSEKIDLNFIKQLEDDIYRTKNELYNECAAGKVAPKQLHTKKTCYECNQVISTPNRITDQKMIEFKLSHFNKRQHAVLLLDAWQLQPITMRREDIKLCDNDSNNNDGGDANEFFCGYRNDQHEKMKNKQYVVIVDNSSYYPVFMSYEIGKQKHDFSTESNEQLTCKCIDSDAYTRDFTRIFRNSVKQLAGQIQNTMPNISLNEVVDSDAMQLSSPHHIPAPNNNNINKSVKIYYPLVNNSSRLPPPPPPPLPSLPLSQQQQPLPSLSSSENDNHGIKIKKSRFENFLKIYSYPSLKNFLRKKKTEKQKQHMIADVNPAPILSSASSLPKNVMCPKQIPNLNSLKVKQIFTQRNQKLHWLLHTKPKIEKFKVRLRQRPRSYSTTISDEILRKNAVLCDSNEILITMPNDYTNEFCQLFRRISWSCSDLLDINRAVNLRVMYLNRGENLIKHSKLDRKTATNQVHSNLCDTTAVASTTTTIMNLNKYRKRKTDRSVSFRRLKRHSIGSNSTMTDTVKAWVYRRRC